MMKRSYIKPVGLALTLLAAAIVQVQANQSNPTLPVQGKGAPAAPTSVTASPELKVGTASTASASGYNDPDGDPLASWEFEWRSGANGTGDLLGSAETYTPADTSPVYLRGRALAGRGYPAEQLTGAWQEVVFTPATNLAPGEVANGSLIFSQPMGTTDTWSQANTYCTNLGNGYRLPSLGELSALYSAKGNMNTYAGWPTDDRFYWSSTVAGAGSYNVVFLFNGYVGSDGESSHNHVSCVRSGS